MTDAIMQVTENHETHAQYHKYARNIAATLVSPDKKQLRFNEIVEAAIAFYHPDVLGGIRELVMACDRANGDLYVSKRPMYKVLREEYAWMIGDASAWLRSRL